MGRAPCCEKMGLKKGPWTPEEDRILIAHIKKHGHANWRALPKQAGLLRCGKSCRLRWINYLRPDIKRGNFSLEEEETIINLHELLGNRWSVIAARLPGRTDNEIKNVWHTHLKKRLLKQKQSNNSDTKQNSTNTITKCDSNITTLSESDNSDFPANAGSSPLSPQTFSSGLSSLTVASLTTGKTNQDYMEIVKDEQIDSFEDFPQIDESFWTDPISDETTNIMLSDFGGIIDEFQLQSQFTQSDQAVEQGYNNYSTITDDSIDFWHNILLTTGQDSTLPFF